MKLMIKLVKKLLLANIVKTPARKVERYEIMFLSMIYTLLTSLVIRFLNVIVIERSLLCLQVGVLLPMLFIDQ